MPPSRRRPERSEQYLEDEQPVKETWTMHLRRGWDQAPRIAKSAVFVVLLIAFPGAGAGALYAFLPAPLKALVDARKAPQAQSESTCLKKLVVVVEGLVLRVEKNERTTKEGVEQGIRNGLAIAKVSGAIEVLVSRSSGRVSMIPPQP